MPRRVSRKRSTKGKAKKTKAREGSPQLIIMIKPRKIWPEMQEAFTGFRYMGVLQGEGCMSFDDIEALAARPGIEFWLVRGMLRKQYVFTAIAVSERAGVLTIKSLCAGRLPQSLLDEFTERTIQFAIDSGYRKVELDEPDPEFAERFLDKTTGSGRRRVLSAQEVMDTLRLGNRVDPEALARWIDRHPDPDGYFVLQVARAPPTTINVEKNDPDAPEFWDGVWRSMEIYLVVPASNLEAVWQRETQVVGQEPVLRYPTAM